MGPEDHTDIGVERKVLQALCQDDQNQFRNRAFPRLAGYRFRDAAHQVVFDAIRQAAAVQPRLTRPELQRRLVFSGFPGIPAEEFFEPHGLDQAALLALLGQLVQT